MTDPRPVLLLGSAPSAVVCQEWSKDEFSAIVAINNAWRIRPDWDYNIFPDDFPEDRHPDAVQEGQSIVTSEAYVPANNQFSGIVYAGGTMVFSAGYWVLAALRPAAIVVVGCDMVYPKSGKTHFYGTGTADPLRQDPSLRNLEAKSARLMYHAASQGCLCFRAPEGESRLVFPLWTGAITTAAPQPDHAQAEAAQALEAEAGYVVPSGRYWDVQAQFSLPKIDAIDTHWQATYPD